MIYCDSCGERLVRRDQKYCGSCYKRVKRQIENSGFLEYDDRVRDLNRPGTEHIGRPARSSAVLGGTVDYEDPYYDDMD